jgi:POT family proton-dependent oligopeptide transporter
MAVGIIIMGLGFLFMRFASQQYEATGSSAMYWLVLAYLFHTIGELCASPVALSFITKLAPVKYASFMMGAYFAATGLGNKLAGLIGESAAGAGETATFTGVAIFTVVFGLIVLALLKPLKRLTHGAEDLQIDNAH